MQKLLTAILLLLSFVPIEASSMPNGEGDKAYINREYYEAFRMYLKEADAGDSHAASMLGYMHAKGFGTSRADAKLAYNYFIKSSRQGDEIATINLAMAYAFGIGTTKDIASAKDILNTLHNHDIKNGNLTVNKNELLKIIDNDLLYEYWAKNVYLVEPYIEKSVAESNAASTSMSAAEIRVDSPEKPELKNDLIAEAQCTELGFKKKTKKFSKCLSTLQSKNNIIKTTAKSNISSEVQRGDGSPNDNTCQKYGFKVGDESYKQCLMDIKIAEERASEALRQYEMQKKSYEEQVRQYDEQMRLYEAAIEEQRAKKQREDNVKLLTFGLGLASGRTLREAAPALDGQPMLLRERPQFIQPPQPNFQNFQLRTPYGTSNCNFNAMMNRMDCR
jgi:hypothetical protein